jgi:NAD(P)-dependent dehydrogenase (short-subunit alcohol dehydrogenase family)
MSDQKVWLVTGAGRGLGVDIAEAALAAGHAVVATGRNPETVIAAVGAHDDLLVVALDVTDPASAAFAVQATVDRFGRLDVLVKNAATSTPGSSRNSARRNSGRRSRPRCSARSMSPAPPCR